MISPIIGRSAHGKKNSPQAFQPAGCPVDCLGLTEVVTLVAPRFDHPVTRKPRVPGTPVSGAGHSVCLADQTLCLSISPYSRIVCERMFSICPTKGSSRTPLR